MVKTEDKHQTAMSWAESTYRSSVWQCVSELVGEIQRCMESYPDYYDEIADMGFVTEVEENQYRIYQQVGEPDDYHIVEITEIDQDDAGEPYVDSISSKEFAAWLWETCSEDVQQHYRQEYAKYLSEVNCNLDPVESPTDFNWDSEDDREFLFKMECKRPSDTDDLTKYLIANRDDWNLCYKLLAEGDEPATTDLEVFEYWLVNDWVGRKLQSVGEKVVELMNLTIWCRTTTGQSIWMDSCFYQLWEKENQDETNA
jgi:hypothetical protein